MVNLINYLCFLNALQVVGEWFKKTNESRKRHVDLNASKVILPLYPNFFLASYIQNNLKERKTEKLHAMHVKE